MMGTISLEIKAVIALVLSVFALGGWWYVDHKGYERGKAAIQAECDADKAEKAKAAARQAADSRKKERIANEKTRQAQRDYAKTKAALDAALARYDGVCSAEIVPRDNGLRMARSPDGSVPGITPSATRTTPTPETSTSARPSFKFSDAMSDTLQCSRLIEWVKTQGM